MLDSNAPLDADCRRTVVFMYTQGSLHNLTLFFRDILEMITNPNPCDHGFAINLLDVSFNIGIELARSGWDLACFQHAG
jgi:hypothetical protein